MLSTRDIILLVVLAVVSLCIILKVRSEYYYEDGSRRNYNGYNFSDNSTNASLATFAQAYIDPPNLLRLPPPRKMPPPSQQKLNFIGMPNSMFKGSNIQAEYTPDNLWCKHRLE